MDRALRHGKLCARAMIRRCDDHDFELVWTIINDGASAYKGTIPEDRWNEPYMSREGLRHEIGEGVAFWGYEESGLWQALWAFRTLRT